MATLTVAPADVRSGDWAEHYTGRLDARQIVAVDHAKGTLTLDILGEESDPLPMGNYTYSRIVEAGDWEVRLSVRTDGRGHLALYDDQAGLTLAVADAPGDDADYETVIASLLNEGLNP